MDKKQRMKNIVKKFQHYVATYSNQYMYQSYEDEIYIDDMLYGIGISIDEEQYQNFGGYQLWKQKIIDHINKDNKKCEEEPEVVKSKFKKWGSIFILFVAYTLIVFYVGYLIAWSHSPLIM